MSQWKAFPLKENIQLLLLIRVIEILKSISRPNESAKFVEPWTFNVFWLTSIYHLVTVKLLNTICPLPVNCILKIYYYELLKCYRNINHLRFKPLLREFFYSKIFINLYVGLKMGKREENKEITKFDISLFVLYIQI